MNSHDITVLPFRPENQSEVKDLVLAGLAEHWGMLDPARNPDLDDIEHTYADAVFLVAWQKGRVIGTGALVPRAGDTGEIVRMSIAAEMRRQGIGRMILQRLCERARSKGYKRLVLETTETWADVIKFYKNFGFEATHHRDGDVYFSLEL